MPSSISSDLPDDEQAREIEERYVEEREAGLRTAIRAEATAEKQVERELAIQRGLVDLFDRHDVLYSTFPPHDDVIICEGDSWFNHPGLFTISDALDRILGFSVLHSDRPGKLLNQSVADKHFLAPLKDSRKRQIKALLLSGGGNDLINWRRNGAKHSPIFRKAASTDPDAFIDHAEVNTALESMAGQLKEIAHLLTDAGASKLPVLIHCYDHIIPHEYRPSPLKGTWIEPQLADVGAEVPALQSAITQKLQDQWMESYRQTCHTLGWTFVNLRGCVQNDWYDEIHPHSAGFLHAANLFAEALTKLGVRPSRKIEQLTA